MRSCFGFLERRAMNGNGQRGAQLAGLVLAFLVLGPAWAGERETRNYVVNVDGRDAGAGQLVIDTQDDGTTVVTGATDVKVRVLFFKYTYWYRGREVWKDRRLQTFESSSDDNGKHYAVNAAADSAGLRITVNGRTRRISGDAWTTSYWRLPDLALRNGGLLLLDADTGRDLAARLQNLGEQTVSVSGEALRATHYRLAGAVTVDLWFDATERMVRQDWVEDGHRTIIQLSRVSR
jgi:hypothetical protein